ncbi:hypothetical protein N7478_010093 [Penicillium angulare]|uniref:uncharacterized protein n=1 Tax=Penicillium angulare TaxID=116970 RepID=UPI0025403357|nr:uncharacterized protein N7478_010093 [Penicillium angulare]KAJ5267285.1 hypothetical protein N7478_010093 [Penicillium angulare]
MSKQVHSDAEWRRLVEEEKRNTDERRRALFAGQEAMKKVLHLERHETLLRSHANDSIVCGYQEISDLVELDCREAEKIARLEKERAEALVAKQSRLAHEVKGFASGKGGLSSECGASSSSHIASSSAGDVNQTRAATSESPTPRQMIVSTDSSSSTSCDDLETFLTGYAGNPRSPVDDTVEPAGNSSLGS